MCLCVCVNRAYGCLWNTVVLKIYRKTGCWTIYDQIEQKPLIGFVKDGWIKVLSAPALDLVLEDCRWAEHLNVHRCFCACILAGLAVKLILQPGAIVCCSSRDQKTVFINTHPHTRTVYKLWWTSYKPSVKAHTTLSVFREWAAGEIVFIIVFFR